MSSVLRVCMILVWRSSMVSGLCLLLRLRIRLFKLVDGSNFDAGSEVDCFEDMISSAL